MSVDTHAVAGLIEPVVTAAQFDLEAVDIKPAGRRSRLIITVDADVVDSDGLATLSREISKTLDDHDALGASAYTLEVTSRGVDAPLTQPRHWRRNRDRLVRIRTTDGQSRTGRIGDSDDEQVTIDNDQVAYNDIERAVVEVEFSPRKGD
jgi:ribosome maturation factor RimP